MVDNSASFMPEQENEPLLKNEVFNFACPVCRGELTWISADSLHCPTDWLTFHHEAGIWRFLPPERAAVLAQFREEYETVRHSEGWGSQDAAFYRALPFVGQKNQQITQVENNQSAQSLMKNGWGERARSFVVLVEQIVRPMEMERQRPLRILDVGAGNGWLSNRLAGRGHWLAAVDLGVNDWDGLGAQRHYESNFTCLQAEFDHLPLADSQADLVIFNASFHYSVDYEVTLREARRVLGEGGKIVVLDTAVYQRQASGEQMVAEREAAFLQQYGFASNSLASENFLTYGRLPQLAATLDLNWQIVWPLSRWRRLVRWLKVKLRRQREPAQFPVLVGELKAKE